METLTMSTRSIAVNNTKGARAASLLIVSALMFAGITSAMPSIQALGGRPSTQTGNIQRLQTNSTVTSTSSTTTNSTTTTLTTSSTTTQTSTNSTQTSSTTSNTTTTSTSVSTTNSTTLSRLEISCPASITESSAFSCTASVSPSWATGVVHFETMSSGDLTAYHECTLSGGSCTENFAYTGDVGGGCSVQMVAIYDGGPSVSPSGSLPTIIAVSSCSVAYIGEPDVIMVTCRNSIIPVGNKTGCTVTMSGYTGTVDGDTIAFSTSDFVPGTGYVSGSSCTISGNSCNVTFTATKAGISVISAVFGGAGDLYGNAFSVGAFAITSGFSPSETSTSVSCPTSTTESSTFTCTASVSPPSTNGTLIFETVSGEKMTTSNTCTLSGGRCEGSLSFSGVGGGSAIVVAAVYEGVNDSGPSSSTPVTVTVSDWSSACSVSTTSSTITVTKFCLPTGTTPVGVAYSGGYVYYASYSYGFIMKVNAATGEYSFLTKGTGAYNRFYYSMAVDATGNLWVTRRDVGNDGTPAGVSRISLSTGHETFVVNDSGEQDGIGIVGADVYAAVGSTLYKIDDATSAVTTYSIPGGGGSYNGFVGDSNGNVWFSDVLGGKMFEFNPQDGQFTSYSGFDRPLGVAVLGNVVYVAENCQGCPVVQMWTDGTGMNSIPTNFTPYGIDAVAGFIVWTSSGGDGNICALGGSCINTGEFNYFLADDGSGNIYFSYYGSSGVGKISGFHGSLPPPPPITSTTTTTIPANSTSTTTSSSTIQVFNGSTSTTTTVSITTTTRTSSALNASTPISTTSASTSSATSASPSVTNTRTSSISSQVSQPMDYALYAQVGVPLTLAILVAILFLRRGVSTATREAGSATS